MTGFRSFHGPLQVIAPLGKINLIAGQNNSGKSNALIFASRLAEYLNNPPTRLDVPRISDPRTFEVAIAVDPLDLVERQPQNSRDDMRRVVGALQTAASVNLSGDGLLWFVRLDTGNGQMSNRRQANAVLNETLDIDWHSLLAPVNSDRSTDVRKELARWMAETADLVEIPHARVVAASRRITDLLDNSQHSENDVKTSLDLIKRLAELQSPKLEMDADRQRFNEIVGFLRNVLGDDSATLEVSHDAQQLNVRRGDLLLPLDHLGSGIAQVVILAAAATLEEGSFVCIEEPEVHLHPLLQRKLLRYLSERTTNQYLIATHSAHMLDSELAQVFHSRYAPTGSVIERSGNAHEVAAICADLGYRPSDLLQTNAALWVEGPSDRIYLRRWLQIAAPELREGIHYTVMFYGGRLLNHLSVDDPELDEFISLRRLNRTLIVMIDSDKVSEQSAINATKTRIVTELESQPGISWVTSGRTIENYVPPQLLENALREVHPKRNFVAPADTWSDALRVDDEAVSFRPDKLKVAKAICARWRSGLDISDLHERTTHVVSLIRHVNGLEDPPATAEMVNWV